MKRVSFIMLFLMSGVSMWAQGLSARTNMYDSGYSLNATARFMQSLSQAEAQCTTLE
jgi:hypothetical protein